MQALVQTILLWAIYMGLGVMFVRSFLKRRAALRAWRTAIGGDYDRGARCFVTELELDRHRLPPPAAALLAQSRTFLLSSIALLFVALGVQFYSLGS